jgi:hypothetical protein
MQFFLLFISSPVLVLVLFLFVGLFGLFCVHACLCRLFLVEKLFACLFTQTWSGLVWCGVRRTRPNGIADAGRPCMCKTHTRKHDIKKKISHVKSTHPDRSLSSPSTFPLPSISLRTLYS